MAEEVLDAHAWETSKENVVPIKRGRSAKGLGESLSANRQFGNIVIPPQEQEFEAQLSNPSETETARDLLDVYIKYFKWVRDNYPSDTEKALKLLEVSNSYISVLIKLTLLITALHCCTKK